MGWELDGWEGREWEWPIVEVRTYGFEYGGVVLGWDFGSEVVLGFEDLVEMRSVGE